MEDHGVRKVPPDRPSDELVCIQDRKKTKLSQPGPPSPDFVMEETPPEAESKEKDTPMEHEDGLPSPTGTSRGKPASYKESLLGFNGVDNAGGYPEDDELLSDVFTKEWDLPEITDEVRELMKEYPVIPIEPEEYSEWCRPWNTTLIITVLGRKYNVYTLKYHLGRIWGFTDFDLIDLPNNYFIVRFAEKDGWIDMYKKVLYGGPWVVQHQCIVVQQWSATFDPYFNQPRKVISWVRIPNIPPQCYNKSFITRLGNRIGRTLRVDMNTLSDSHMEGPRVERGKYARICVELDLQKKLISRVIAANSVYNVVYEGLNVICFSCGRYGHRREYCPYSCAGNTQEKPSEGQGMPSPHVHTPAASPIRPTNTPTRPVPQPEEIFGAWMLVGNNQKARFPKKPFVKSKPEVQGKRGKDVRKEKEGGSRTRFDVLGDMEEESEETMMPACSDVSGDVSMQTRNPGTELVIYQDKRKGRVSENRETNAGKWKGRLVDSRDQGNNRLGKENISQNGLGKLGKAHFSGGPSKQKEAARNTGPVLNKEKKTNQRTHVVIARNVTEGPAQMMYVPKRTPTSTPPNHQDGEGTMKQGDHRESEANNWRYNNLNEQMEDSHPCIVQISDETQLVETSLAAMAGIEEDAPVE